MKNLAKKVAVITGAGSGIGRELAIQLSAAGCILALSDIHAENLAETVKMLPQNQKECTSDIVDVANREAVFSWAEKVLDSHGQVDIVINNAGVALGTISFLDNTLEDIEWLLNINLWGVLYSSRAFLPHLLQRPEASLVNISSMFGLLGVRRQVPYSISKFAVRGFSESLHMELKGTSVVVSSVHPGGIRTNIARNARERNPAEKARVAEKFDKVAMISATSAARQIIRGIRRKNSRIMVGADVKTIDRIVRYFPRAYKNILLGLQKRIID